MCRELQFVTGPLISQNTISKFPVGSVIVCIYPEEVPWTLLHTRVYPGPLCIVLVSSKRSSISFSTKHLFPSKSFTTKYLNLHKNFWPENKSRVWKELENSRMVFEFIYFCCFDRIMICSSPSFFKITNLRQKIWSQLFIRPEGTVSYLWAAVNGTIQPDLITMDTAEHCVVNFVLIQLSASQPVETSRDLCILRIKPLQPSGIDSNCIQQWTQRGIVL